MSYNHVAGRSETGATAPYNFVPLPVAVRFAPEEPPTWDQFHADRHTGWIDVTATLETPLFVGRGGPHLGTEPFLDSQKRPVIPGSSLRGWLRFLVEILSFSKISQVSNEQPFYRGVGKDRVAGLYRARMVGTDADGRAKVRAGILGRRDGAWVIQPYKHAKLKYSTLAAAGAPTTPRQLGRIGQSQHRELVKLFRGRRVRLSDLNERPPFAGAPNQHWAGQCDLDASPPNATLALSGWMTNKTSEFAILDETDGAEVPIPDSVIARFNSEDQLTQYQERQFPRGGGREQAGWLKDGEMVFFVTGLRADVGAGPDDAAVLDLFLGRAGLFRLPYDLSPRALLPPEHHDARLDLCQAMFGRVSRGQATIRGRIRVGDLTARSADAVEPDPVRLKILSSPKVTAFAHYLTQGSGQLTSYFHGDQTTIRGHKLYWQRWDGQRGWREQVELRDPKADKRGTQSRSVQPVKAGTTFTGRIHFENLSNVELGALVAALTLWDGSRHRLGMGKPLGMGTVRLNVDCRVLDLERRYRSWHPTDDQVAGVGQDCLASFVDFVHQHCQASGEPTVGAPVTIEPTIASLRRWARLDVLAMLLEWNQRRPANDTAQMELAAFNDARVLPNPEVVATGSSHPWVGEMPTAQAPPEERKGRIVRGRPPFARAGAPQAAAPRFQVPLVGGEGIHAGQPRKVSAGPPGKKGKATYRLTGSDRSASFGPNPAPQGVTEGDEIDVVVTQVPPMEHQPIIVKLAE